MAAFCHVCDSQVSHTSQNARCVRHPRGSWRWIDTSLPQSWAWSRSSRHRPLELLQDRRDALVFCLLKVLELVERSLGLVEFSHTSKSNHEVVIDRFIFRGLPRSLVKLLDGIRIFFSGNPHLREPYPGSRIRRIQLEGAQEKSRCV